MTEWRFGLADADELSSLESSMPNWCVQRPDPQFKTSTLDSKCGNAQHVNAEFQSLSAKFQQVADENMANIRRATALESENTELKAKLDILIQKNADLAANIEALKKSSETEQSLLRNRLETQLRDLKLESTHESTASAIRETDLKREIDEKDLEIKRLNNEMLSLFRAASQRYHTEITTFDSLLLLLTQTPEKPVKREVPQDTVNITELKRLKKKNRKMRERFEIAESEMTEELCDIRRDFIRKEESFKSQLLAARKMSDEQQLRINELIQKNNDLSIENAKLSTQLETLKCEQSKPAQEPKRCDLEIQKLKATNESLRHKVRVLKQQIATCIGENNAAHNSRLIVKTRLREYEEEMRNMKAEITHMRTEAIDAQTQNAKLSEEIDNLKQKIATLQRESDRKEQTISDQEMEIEEKEQELEQSKYIIARQEKDIAEQQKEVAKHMSMLQTQKFVHLKMEEEIARLQEAKAEKTVNKPQKKFESAIPIECFCCDILPRGVSKMVMDVAENPNLRPQAKVKQAITLVHQHYRDLVQALEDEIKNIKFVHQQQLSDYRTVVESLRWAVPDIDISSSTKAADVIQRKLQEQKATVKEAHEKEEAITLLLHSLEASDIGEGERNLERLKDALRVIKKKSDIQHRKIKLLRRHNNALLVENDALRENLRVQRENEALKYADAARSPNVATNNLTVVTDQTPFQQDSPDLCGELRRSQMKIESLKAEMEREKKLILACATAEGLKREANLQELIRQLKAELEKTKKDLMTFVGCQFSSLVDVEEGFTEGNFRKFIKRIRAELDRLTKTEENVRRMFASQSTEASMSRDT